MPIYSYTARSLSGESLSGNREAKDEYDLARVLRQEGYILVLATTQKKEKERKFSLAIPFLGRVPLPEKIMFTRNLQVMTAAGIPLPRAIRTLAKQTKTKMFREAILDIAEKINEGRNFSDSLSEHPDVFSEFYCSMVKVGEEAGTMEEVLLSLTNKMEKEYELISKIKGAMIYPAVIIIAMMGVGILMLVTVVPALAETFEELGIELPITTRIVIGSARFLTQRWYVLLLAGFSSFFLFYNASRSKKGKGTIDGILLKLPIFSELVKKTNSAGVIRTLSSLISSGVPIVRALEIVAGTASNFYFKQTLNEAAEKVRKGAKLSEVLSPYQDLYSLLVIQMLEVGEETGRTSDILAKLADFYEEEVATATQNLASVIEPLLMLLIGTVIGFFAVSMLQPMYSMLGAI